MSKITVTELQGHTSGGDANKVKIKTGHELEVVSGDLTVDTSTLKVNSSNNRVGIGTASPTVPLEVAGDIKESVSGANAQISAITDGASNYATFTATNGARSYSMQIRPDQSNAFTVRDETAGGNRFLINTSGHMNVPNQPMCSAGAGTSSGAGTQEITNMGVIVNNGNHYNTSNGRFTCPVAGIYEVNVHMLSGYAAAYNWIAIFKNGSPVQNMHWNPDSASGHHYTGLSCLQTAAANDTLSGGIQNVNGVATATAVNFYLTVKLIG